MEKIISFSSKVLIFLTFIVTIFFLPSSFLNLTQSKVFIFQIVVSFVTVVFLIMSFRKKSFGVHNCIISFLMVALPIVYLLSALVNPNYLYGIFGSGFDIDTVSTVFLLSALFFVVSRFFVTKKRITSFFLVFVSSAFISILFQVFHILVPSITFFGNFPTTDIGLFGKWNNLTIVCFIVVMINILALENIIIPRFLRVFLFVSFIPIFFIITVSNLSFSFGIFSIFIYQFIGVFGLVRMIVFFLRSKKQTKEKMQEKFPFASLIAFVFGLVMLFFGSTVSLFTSQASKVSFVEMRPSWDSTLHVLPKVISDSPVLGDGPNSFKFIWNRLRPDVFNTNIFWNTDIGTSSSFVSTSFFSIGILGIVFWIPIIIFSIWYAFKLIIKKTSKDKGMWSFIRKSIGYTFLVLTLSITTYSPDFIIILFYFVFLGLLLSVCVLEGFVGNRIIDWSKSSRVKETFFNSLVVVIILASFVNFFEIGRRAVGSVYANRSVVSFNKGDLLGARENIKKSLSFFESPYFLSILAQTNFSILSSSLDSTKINKDEVRILIDETIQSSLKAESLEPRDFRLNLISGDILSGFGRLGAEDGFSGALVKTKEANQKNPNHPLPPFLMGQTYLQSNDLQNAKDSFTEAIRLKPNYIEAYLAVIDILRREEDLDSARKLFDFILGSNPTDDYLKLERVKFEMLDFEYDEAISILDKIIEVRPDFFDALYLRSVALKDSDRLTEALQDAMVMKRYLPDDKTVDSLIKDINNQRDLKDSEEEDN